MRKSPWFDDHFDQAGDICFSDGRLGRRPAGRAWGYSIPNGMRRSAIPVHMVCGPPGAGKTSYVREHKRAGDIVIDFDDFLEAVGAKRWDRSPAAIREAFRWRDGAIRGLSVAPRDGRQAWLIVCAPTAAERQQWLRALGPRADVIMLATPADICIQRINATPERAHAARVQIKAVHDWWEKYRP